MASGDRKAVLISVPGRFSLPLGGVRGRAQLRVDTKKDPHIGNFAFLFAVAAALPQPLPKGGEQMLFSI
jgi:hypothetical protein